MTRAVIYARFSPRPDEVAAKTETIQHQTERCEAYCKAHGYEVLAVCFDREMSGARADNRVGLQEALSLACAKRAVVVVYSLSRLARNTADAIQIAGRLDKAGAQVASLTERIDTTSPQGQLFFTILAAFAQFEREAIAQRTRDAMQRHQRTGRRMTRADKLPYGWKPDPADPSHMVEAPLEQETIRMMLEYRAAGSGLREIGRRLTELGFDCRGGPWHHHTIKRIIERAEACKPETSPAA